jgi:hypothetical protein
MALDISKIRALAFDVFGTTVDWFTTITRESSKLAEAKGISGVDWMLFLRGTVIVPNRDQSLQENARGLPWMYLLGNFLMR